MSVCRWTNIFVAAVLVFAFGVVLVAPVGAVPIGDDSFRRTWERTDKPVADGQVSRTWMWGPEAYTGVLTEEYEDSPGHQRRVQYFDKSRMEITNPAGDQSSPWYVTNGLLVVEMVDGRLQRGNEEFDETPAPAQVNVAGDADDPTGPTYATFSMLRHAEPHAPGAVITSRVDRSGNITNDNALSAHNVVAAHLVDVPGIRHQVASPFWAFMNSQGIVYEAGQFTHDNLFEDPFYATGYPITEAYWARVKVANTYRDVLMQCFERRCLTYTPDNPAGWQVEAGNVGQHYYQWRYGSDAPPPPPPGQDVPTEGEILYQSNLGNWPERTNDSGAIGTPNDDRTAYVMVTPPDDAFYVFGAGPYGDASYSVDVYSIEDIGDGTGCLVIRGSDAGAYHLCLVISSGRALGTLAFYLDITGAGELVELGTFPFAAPTTPEQLFTIKMIASGSQFWFFVEGQQVGTTTHAGSSEGLVGFSVICTDEFDPCGAGFTNLVVRSLQGGGNPPPPPPPPPSTTTFSDGTHIVGSDIPAGTYRNSDSSGGCYWERLSGLSGDLDDIIANDFTYARSIVTIAPSDYAFSSARCGTWTSDLSAITASPTAPFSDGTYIVEVDIAPGTWRNSDSSDGCYWARLSGFSGNLRDIIDNEFTYDAIQTVTIRSSDEGFQTSGCGTWTKIN